MFIFIHTGVFRNQSAIFKDHSEFIIIVFFFHKLQLPPLYKKKIIEKLVIFIYFYIYIYLEHWQNTYMKDLKFHIVEYFYTSPNILHRYKYSTITSYNSYRQLYYFQIIVLIMYIFWVIEIIKIGHVPHGSSLSDRSILHFLKSVWMTLDLNWDISTEYHS